MPLIEVKVYDSRINDETVSKLIEKLTDAMVECTSEEVRPLTHVIVEGLPANQWGTGGTSHA